jgi:hypothetical protein
MTTTDNARTASSLTSEDVGCTLDPNREMELLEVLESGRPNSVQLRVNMDGRTRDISMFAGMVLQVHRKE